MMNKNRRLVGWLVLSAVLMFLFGFALVPLYNVMCKQLGINGKTNATAAVVGQAQEDRSRQVTIEFTTTLNETMPWDFYPMQKKVEMHPGGSFQTAYFARNLTGKKMTVQAIPSVTPGLAAQYIQKLECFCFQKQSLEAGQSAEMPLKFVLSADLPADIHTMTLSYTLFDLKE